MLQILQSLGMPSSIILKVASAFFSPGSRHWEAQTTSSSRREQGKAETRLALLALYLLPGSLRAQVCAGQAGKFWQFPLGCCAEWRWPCVPAGCGALSPLYSSQAKFPDWQLPRTAVDDRYQAIKRKTFPISYLSRDVPYCRDSLGLLLGPAQDLQAANRTASIRYDGIVKSILAKTSYCILKMRPWDTPSSWKFSGIPEPMF